MNIGAHVTISRGLVGAVEAAHALGATTFQIFSRNPRGRGSGFDRLTPAAFREQIKQAAQLRKKYGIRSFYVHTPYYTNLASPKDTIWRASIRAIVTDLALAEEIGSGFFVMHVGHHMEAGSRKQEAGKRKLEEKLEAGRKRGLARVVAGLKEIKKCDKSKTKLLLEITAGQGTEIGNSFEELAAIIKKSGWPESKIGVAFDTCHAFGAGYDLRTASAVRETLMRLDRVIGLKRVPLVHANDSLGGLGEHKDRHAHIGSGKIGRVGFAALLHQPALRDKDFIVETKEGRQKKDIAVLSKMGGK